jgi:hypothetical protein
MRIHFEKITAQHADVESLSWTWKSEEIISKVMEWND